MEDSTQTLTIKLHYNLDKEGSHLMDANIHNKCEANIIEAINHLADIFDEDISLDVSALNEGGLIDTLKITLKNSTVNSVILILVGALINHFISPSTSLDETQKLLNRAEVIQKIKEGNYTEADIKYIISGDAKLLSSKSKYYKELDKEARVTSVSCTTFGENCPSEAEISNKIDKRDFHKQVINNTTKSDVQIYYGTTVLVISPVLSKESKAKWKGIFNGKDVSFKIEDNEFLKQVYNKEVGFTTGTSLKCDVKVTTKTMYDMCGNVSSSSTEIFISNIMSWYDDETFQYKTKRYKRKKIIDSQLPLFKDEEF